MYYTINRYNNKKTHVICFGLTTSWYRVSLRVWLLYSVTHSIGENGFPPLAWRHQLQIASLLGWDFVSTFSSRCWESVCFEHIYVSCVLWTHICLVCAVTVSVRSYVYQSCCVSRRCFLWVSHASGSYDPLVFSPHRSPSLGSKGLIKISL